MPALTVKLQCKFSITSLCQKKNLPKFRRLYRRGCLKREKILGIPRKSALKMLNRSILGMTLSENTPF